LIWSVRHRVKIVRYERLTENQNDTLEEITNYLGVSSPRNLKRLSSYNLSSRYANLQKIEHAVEHYCRSKGNFGY